MGLTFTVIFAKNAVMVIPTLRRLTGFKLLGGQIDLMFISLVTGAEQVRAGKLRAYGVTSEKRQPLFPDLPAIGETVIGFESVAWFGVFAPANLSDAITEKLNAVVVAAVAEPKLRDQLKAEGATSVEIGREHV